jgi:hypothetical protein
MESWEVVRRMVPRGTSHIMARMMRVTSDYVRRWRKPAPEFNEDGAVAASNSLTLEGCTDHTLECLVKFIEAGEGIKEKVQIEIRNRGGIQTSNVQSMSPRLHEREMTCQYRER